MRIVKLSDLSEKERKKVLEEQEKRYQQNQAEREQQKKQANQKFIEKFGSGETEVKHTTTPQKIIKSIDSQESRNQFKKNNNLRLWDQVQSIAKSMGYIGKRTGAGTLGGFTGIGQAGLTDVANQMQKGEKENVGKTIADTFTSILGLANPSYLREKAIKETIKDNFSILLNKDKNAKQKAVEYLTNSASAGTNMLPEKKTFNEMMQLLGKVNNKSDDVILQANNKISKPVESLNERLQQEGQQYGKATNWLGDAGQIIGNMIPAIAGTVATKNPNVGLATMGVSAKGQATQEALNKGMDLDTAVKIGDTKALIEIATEKLSGGLGVLGKGSLDDFAEEFIKKGAKSTFGKFLLKQGYNITGEVTEELISDLANNIIDKGTTDPNKKIVNLGEGLDTMGKTAFTTLVLNGLAGGYQQDYNVAKQQTLEQQKQFKDYNTGKAVDNETQNIMEQAQNIVRQEERKAQQPKQQENIETNKDITQEIKTPQNRFTRVKNNDNNKTNTQTENKSFEDVVFDAMQGIENNEVETPLKDRNINTIGKETKKNAYQYDNPKVKPYYQEMAQQIGEDLAYVSSSENRSTKKGGGTKLSTTTQAIDILHNEQGYSYNQIAQGLQNIIDDNGKENNAISKKLELIIDDQLRNGYTNALGKSIEPNQEYINTIQQNQQVQDAKLPIKEKKKIRLPIKQEANINQEQNQVKAKDTNEVMNEVQKYIKNNDLDMTTNEFVEWASNVELENEENMTQEQKELYSLISDIQNRANMKENDTRNNNIPNNVSIKDSQGREIDHNIHTYSTDAYEGQVNMRKEFQDEDGNTIAKIDYNYFDGEINVDVIETNPEYRRKGLATRLVKDLKQDAQEEGVKINYGYTSQEGTALLDSIEKLEKNNKKVYNIINKSISNEERRQVDSEVKRWRLNQEDGIGYIDLSKNGYKSYIYNKQGNDTEVLLKVNGSEEFKNFIRKEIENGTYKKSTNINGWVANTKLQYRNNSNDNDVLSNRENSKGNGRIYDRTNGQQARDNRTNAIKQNSRNESIENSKESSFSFTDNQGRQLSNQQQEYFKDSKVRDENGNLLTVYHGTRAKFNVFDIKKAGTNYENNWSSLGKGFYFTPNFEYANEWAKSGTTGKEKNVKECYLDIKNPFYINENYVDQLSQLKEKYKIDDFSLKKGYRLIKVLNENGFNSTEILKNLGFDGIIEKYGNDIEQIVVFEPNQIKNIDNKAPTDNPDIRYELEDTSNNTAENEIQRKINRSMTMKEAEDMIQRAFVTGKIYDWYDGKYKNGNEWLQGEGAEDVSMWIENDYNLQQKYINSNEDILNEEYTIDDVIEAYQNKTLTGNEKKQTQRLDTSKDTGYKDERFFAPKEATGGKELYDLANQRVTNNNRNEVYKARADFIINAHNEGYVNELGLTQKEVNEKLRKWANYPLKARNISGYINKGVATENKWVGIENSSIVNKLSVSTEQLDSLVKEVKGTSDEYQRKYIVDTMLALDTHLDYKGLTYDFAPDVAGMGENALADYSSKNDTIRVKREGLNTIAHETGHYIDHLLGREIGNGYDLGITSLCREYSNKNLTEQQKQFLSNFNNFLNSIEDVSDIGSTYKMSSNEVFARFTARFVEWTRNTATGNKYGYEAKWYNDNFTQPQFVEFAKLLQEYSLLKTTNQVSDKKIKTDNKVYEQRISDIYEELNKKKKQVENKPFRSREEIANDKSITDLESIREESEKVFTPDLETAIEKENTLKRDFDVDNSPTIDYVKNKRSKEKTSFGEIKDVLAQKFVNKGHYIDKLANKTSNKKLTWLYDRTMSSFNEAMISIGNNQVDSKGKVIGKSLLDIFQPAEDSKLLPEFEDYLLNKHNISRYAHEKGIFGKEISSADSQKIVDNYEKKYPEFKKWSKEVSKYNDNNLKDLVNNGMVSQETYDKLREMYGDYVPTYRDITENLSQYLDDDSVGGNTLGRATESNRDILSVRESMAEQTLAIKKAIRINNLGVELFKTLNPSKNDILLDGINLDGNAILSLGGDIISKSKDGTNTFTIFQDGDMTTFKISDDLYSAFTKDTLQNKINNNKVAKAILTPVEKMSKAQRDLLTTYSVGFALNNPIKDFQDALFNTKYSDGRFVKNWTKALYNIATNGDWYQSYKNNGGTANSYFDYNKGLLPTKTKNPLKKFANGIKNVNEIFEHAPRLAEYISTIETGGSIDEALYNASEITVNFKRGGDITKAVNKYGANFLNASVQGLDKFYRNLTGQNGWKGYANILTKATLFQIAPAIINGLLLGDDDDYEDLPEYTKDNYFLFKTGKGKFFRIPKGRVSSLIGGIARRGLETAQGKEVDWNALVDTAINQMAPNNPLTDNIIAPLIQAKTNKSWYGGDIESSRLQKLPVAERSDETTDKLSKFLGEKLNISPKKINYVLDQYSGGIGDVLLPMGTPQAENNILEDKFTTDSVLKNKNVSKFYSLLEEAEQNKNSSKATDEDQLKYKYLSSASSEAGKLYAQKREIQNSNLSDKEKREKVRNVQEQINNIIEDALEETKKIKVNDTSATIGGQEYYKKDGTWKKLTDKEKSKLKDTSISTYSSYQKEISDLKNQKISSGELEDGQDLSNTDKIQLIRNSNYSSKEKSNLYEKTISTDQYYPTLKKSGVNIDEYMDYKIAQNEGKFKADRKNGEIVYGSGKEKTIQYLNDNITGVGNRLLIAGKQYALSDNERKILSEYIDKTYDTKKEKLEVYKQLKLNFVVNGDNVKYKPRYR